MSHSRIGPVTEMPIPDTFSSRIDRIAPTKRPPGRCQGYQKWRDLLFLHWAVPVETMRGLVPSAFDLDLYEGRAYVGLVPFAMMGVRPRWWPEILGFNFLETNVRTYVTYQGQPGVYFFSLDAASRIAVWSARTFWKLPYFHAEMSLRQTGDEFVYHSRRDSGEVHKVRYRLGRELGPSKPETVEFFLLERYLLFTESRGRIYEGQVHHNPYPAQEANVLELEDQLIEAAGLGPCSGMPEFTHYAAGVDVEIFSLQSVASGYATYFLKGNLKRMTDSQSDKSPASSASQQPTVWHWLLLSLIFVAGIAFAAAHAPRSWQRPGPTALWLAVISGVFVGGIAAVNRVQSRKLVGGTAFVLIALAIAGMTAERYRLYVNALKDLYLGPPQTTNPNQMAETLKQGPVAQKLMKEVRVERRKVYESKRPLSVFLKFRLRGLGVTDEPWPVVFFIGEIVLGGLAGAFAAVFWHRWQIESPPKSES